MIKFTLLFQSLLNRWLSCLLIILTLSFSISLFFTVSRIQESVRSSFQNTVSGVDSVVAARGGNLQILLNSVFLIGEPNSTIRWSTYKDITDNNKMNWAVPISLGDSHKGYRVIGTTNNYFKEIKYSSGKNIEFLSGNSFNDVFDVVLGSAVANKLKYNLGTEIIITHGLSNVGEVHTFHSDKENHDDHAKHEEHDDHSEHADEGHEGHDHENLGFKVTGILKPTGTPIDNAVYLSLAGIEAMHSGWIGNQKVVDLSIEQILQSELKPKTISAIFVSLKNRTQVFQFQRDVLNYKKEAISSVMPGITLSRLWALTGNVDKAFKIITFFIIIIALLGMIAMTIAGLNGRRREMAILRSVGASPTNIVSLLLVESIIISLISCVIGYILMIVIFSIGKDYLQNNYGIFINSFSIKNYDLQMIISIICAALIATIVPAIQIYKNTLRDGLNVKS
ncbi:MAG: FtsX-like permease family protein [Alphaproteobacteria bacterium]|nr:FtsX-like permease family protein [Alphaproteobacteria bacterium]